MLELEICQAAGDVLSLRIYSNEADRILLDGNIPYPCILVPDMGADPHTGKDSQAGDDGVKEEDSVAPATVLLVVEDICDKVLLRVHRN